MHPCFPLFHHKDYFAPVRCISILLFCSTGIISTGQMHPSPALFHHGDYFSRSDTSLITENISVRPFHQIQSDMKLFSPNPGQSSEMRTGYPYASNRIPASSLAPVLSNEYFLQSYHKKQQKRGPNAPAPGSYCSKNFCQNFLTRTSLPCSVRSPSYP